jgi:hypothetical protein
LFERATSEKIEIIREELGLNEWKFYCRWVIRMY